MTRGERETLRGFIALAWNDRHAPVRARLHAERICDWYQWGRFAGQLRRREQHVDELVELLRRTRP